MKQGRHASPIRHGAFKSHFLLVAKLLLLLITVIQHDPRQRFLELRPKEKVSEYIARHIDAGRIFVGCEGNEKALAYAIERVGPQPFMFASDFPHEISLGNCSQ